MRYLVVAALLAACHAPSTPAQLPSNGIQLSAELITHLSDDNADEKLHAYAQPEIYRRWWIEVQRCTRMRVKLDVGEMTFYAVDADAFTVPESYTLMDSVVTHPSVPLLGLSTPTARAVWLVDKYKLNERLVKHEMAHQLQYEYGIDGDHNEEWWNRCEIVS